MSDLIREWTRALRSGKYTQGKGRLRQIEGEMVTYCALGVLCEISLEEFSVSYRDYINEVLQASDRRAMEYLFNTGDVGGVSDE